MGAKGKLIERQIMDYILDRIGATELNSLIDVQIEGKDIWFTLEDGSVKSLVIVNAGRHEPQKLE